MPTEENEILSYLASGVVKGVGPATASAIVQRFGANSLMVLEEEPGELTKIKGISPRRAREIGEGSCWRRMAPRPMRSSREVSAISAGQSMSWAAAAISLSLGRNTWPLFRL